MTNEIIDKYFLSMYKYSIETGINDKQKMTHFILQMFLQNLKLKAPNEWNDWNDQ